MSIETEKFDWQNGEYLVAHREGIIGVSYTVRKEGDGYNIHREVTVNGDIPEGWSDEYHIYVRDSEKEDVENRTNVSAAKDIIDTVKEQYGIGRKV